MAEKQRTPLYYIYDDLYQGVKGVADKVSLGRRPKQTKEELKSFLVIKLESRIRNLIAGGLDRMPYCYGTVTVFCKAKDDGTLNIEAQSDLVDAVIKKFPIAGTHIAATRPQILMQGEDGYGYQVTQISFTIRGKKFD